MVARDLGKREEISYKEIRELRGVMGMFCLVIAVLTRLYTFAETHQIVHLKLVKCVVHKLHAGKAAPPKASRVRDQEQVHYCGHQETRGVK